MSFSEDDFKKVRRSDFKAFVDQQEKINAELLRSVKNLKEALAILSRKPKPPVDYSRPAELVDPGTMEVVGQLGSGH